MQSDENIQYKKRDDGMLSDFGESTPSNSFSGGETDHLFLSRGGEQFYDLDFLSGLAHPGDGRTASMLDYDRDGWIDFVVASANAPTIQLYRNRLGQTHQRAAQGANMVALRFVGGNRTTGVSEEWSARNGFGARAELEVGEKPLIRYHRGGDGRAAQHSATMIVGVGDEMRVASVRVRWPSGRVQSTTNVPTGTLLTVYENPLHSPTGAAFVSETYLRNVLAGRTLAERPAEVLPITPPSGDAVRLNVLTAMSTHCKSCKRLQPRWEFLRRSFELGEVALLGVSTDLDEGPEELLAYVEREQPHYEVLVDLPLEKRRALRDYVMRTFKDDLTPVTVVTDPFGNILATLSGAPSVSKLRALLDRRPARPR